VRGLRRAALLALVCGQLAAAVSDVLPLPLLPLVAGVAVAAERLSARPGRDRVLRAGATVVCFLLTLLLLPQVVTGLRAEDGLRGVLGTLLVGITAVQPLTWARPRDVQTGVVAAVGLLVLGASFAPDVLVGLPLLVGWVACVVAAVLAVRERASAGADVVLAAPAPRTAVPVAAALATVLGLVAFLLVPVPEEAGLRSRLAQAASSAGLAGGRAAPGAYTGEEVDLRVRGELSDVPLVEVPRDSPALWRSGVYTDWDGASWRTGAQRFRLQGPPFVVGRTDGPTRTDVVRVERRAGGPVWAPGPVVSVDLPGRSASTDELGAVRGPTAPGYVVTSAVVAPSLAQLRAAVGADEQDPRWTALPPSLPARVRDLGVELTAGARTRIDAVRAVERYLAANARYDLDSPVPGRDEDAVDRFLFVDRVGFCEQFAAAEVLLLRAADIPARFVTGLAYGVESGRDRRTFRQKDLHAWVEVFHPGLGWVASDPTPPSTQLASAPLRDRVVAQLTAALRRADDVPGGRPALAAGLLVATGLAAAGVLVARRRRPPVLDGMRPLPVHAAGRPALQAFLRFDARLGERRRRPAESLGELQARLAPVPEVRRALQLVDEECYAAVPPAEAAEVAALLDRTT
jgi:transglutaminase-like putative cysteine protease